MHVYPLQFASRPLLLRRDDDQSLTITSLGTPFRTHQLERLVVAPGKTTSAGRIFSTPAFDTVVVEGESLGIQSARFQFRRSLEDPSYRFLAWRENRLAPITIPAIGESVTVHE
jgi:hypothetical protein